MNVTTHLTAGLDELNDSLQIACDEPDAANGSGTHNYQVLDARDNIVATIQFQHGPRGVAGSIPGLTLHALVSICVHHLESFQAGPFKSRDNALAITSLQETLGWIRQRMIERKLRGVLGKLAK